MQNLFKGVRSFDKLITKKYDLVHIHNPVPPLELLRTVIYFKCKNIPIFITSHGFVEVLNFRKAYNISFIFSPFIFLFVTLPFKHSLKYINRAFVFSSYEIKLLQSNNITLNTSPIPNGHTSFDNENISNSDLENIRKKYKLKQDEKVIFFLGNHTPNKGIEDVINCVNYFDFITVIIGGKIRDDYYTQIASMISNENKKIIFTDFISDKEVRCLYKICDVFLFPNTKADTFPLVILDAMYNECTIVTTKIGGIPYQLENNSGLILDKCDPKTIHESINFLFKDEEVLRDSCRNAKLRVIKNFTWKIAADKAIEEYEKYFNENIKFIFLFFSFFSLLFNQYINVLTFSISYFILLNILLFRYSFLDFRVGFVFLLTLYSFYASLNFYISDLDLILPVAYNFIDNISINTQKQAFIINHAFILGVYFNIFYERNYFLHTRHKLILRKIKNFHIILSLITVVLILSLIKLDWNRINNEYNLGGVSNTFFLSYLLFGYLIYSCMNNSFVKFGIILILSIILLYMGVRQVVFWGFLMYVLHTNYKMHKKLLFNSVNFKFLFATLLLLFFFTLAVYFRVNRDHSFHSVLDIDYLYFLSLCLNLFYSETIYTYCNLYQVIENLPSIEYKEVNFVTDFFVQLVPHSFFSEKYNYLHYRIINPDNLLNPFGSWYYVGFIALITNHPIVVFFIAFSICYIFNNTFRIKQLNVFTNNFKYSSYFIIYLFCFLYNTRSPIIGGFKIAFTVILFLLIIDLTLRSRCKRS